MFPLRDENPTELTPIVTVAIIAANVAAWLFLQNLGVGPRFVESLCRFGTIPGELTGRIGEGSLIRLGPYRCEAGGAAWSTLWTSMFLHGGWMHLIGNMWFLWVFGNNIEDSMGHVKFAIFYLLTGTVAAAAHVLSAAGSGIPTVGASGAISGVMGAYLLLYPRVRIYTLFFFFLFIRIIPLPAWLLLGYWFFLQLLLGTSAPAAGGGVAFWAHVGGFVSGLALVKLFERRTGVEVRRGAAPSGWGGGGRFGGH
ncbi:MAG: rhomboid family intramembrane serine protease [Gemmatimonadota bacterium]